MHSKAVQTFPSAFKIRFIFIKLKDYRSNSLLIQTFGYEFFVRSKFLDNKILRSTQNFENK